MELLPVHFALTDEVFESWVVDDRDEEQGRAVGGEADGRVKPEEEYGHVRVCGAVNSHQLETVVVVPVEYGSDDVANFIKRSRRIWEFKAKFHELQILTSKLRLDVVF